MHFKLQPFWKMFSFWFTTIALIIGVSIFAPAIQAQTVFNSDLHAQPVTVQVFVREGCQHCKDEATFLEKLQQEIPNLGVEYLRLEDTGQRERWEQFTDRMKSGKVTPITVIGSQMIIGFGTEETTGENIRQAVRNAQKNQEPTNLDTLTPETLGSLAAMGSTCSEDVPCQLHEDPPVLVKLPWGKTVNAQSYPLIALSAVLGLIDGFNPCAMWVLVTFLVILLKLGSRKKMFQFAGIFILAEAIMYYLILMVWFTAWDFVKLDAIVTPIVGFVAIGGGIFFLYEARKANSECQIVNPEQRYQTKQKLQELVKKNFSLVTLLGILGLAFSVNVIEFACSIGIPQTFTKILEMNQLAWWQSQLLIALYILFYMVDDFVVFGLALFAFDKMGITHKYVRASNIIGGILMLTLGLVMIVKPELLVF
jgi:cytochrome c biogenesis protein CcdA/thiol-disulfide isomerase/thioredoxin